MPQPIRSFMAAEPLALSRIGIAEATTRLREIAANDPQPWIRELAARHNR